MAAVVAAGMLVGTAVVVALVVMVVGAADVGALGQNAVDELHDRHVALPLLHEAHRQNKGRDIFIEIPVMYIWKNKYY